MTGCFDLDDVWTDCDDCEYYDECTKRIEEEEGLGEPTQ